jgi:hypothetical protein
MPPVEITAQRLTAGFDVPRLHSAGHRLYHSPMPKVDHTFLMQQPPEQAQSMFVDEIAPELHRKAELAMCKDEPGHVLFNDGIVDPDDLVRGVNLDELAPGEAGRLLRRSASNDVELFSALREATGHHLHVDFEPEGSGTKVRIHGHVERDVRDGIDLFGQPGRWPETGLVHD